MPVLFNGQPLSQRFAEANLDTMPSAIGAVHLAGTRDGKHSLDTVAFLQGFCVLKPSYCIVDKINVVHLDSRQFMARLPDRDKLIDEDLQRKRIDAVLKACWRRTLEVAKARLSPERFVDTYYAAMRSWGQLDLLNDLDVLPAELCEAIVGYPIQDEHGGQDFVEPVTAAPSRADIESGAVQLVALDSVGDDNGARWMLARSKSYLVFDWIGLHGDHWAQQHVRFLEDEPVQVEAIGEQVRAVLEGRWVWPSVILCDAVRIRVGDDVAEITDEGVCHEGDLYIPAGETLRRAGAPALVFHRRARSVSRCRSGRRPRGAGRSDPSAALGRSGADAGLAAAGPAAGQVPVAAWQVASGSAWAWVRRRGTLN